MDAIDAVADGSLDFAYIDGDHTLRGITLDLLKTYSKVKEGNSLEVMNSALLFGSIIKNMNHRLYILLLFIFLKQWVVSSTV